MRRVSELLASMFAVLALAGCYESHLCGTPEVCNYQDDDCDGLIDEDFLDSNGLYFTDGNCGACGVVCDEVFPTALVSECRVDAESAPPFAACALVSCPPATHLAGSSACVPDVPALCLTCTTDADCTVRAPGATCVPTAGGQTRCATPCEGPLDCPPGFECSRSGELFGCVPSSGVCACGPDTAGAELGCFLFASDGHACAGVQICGDAGFSECGPALVESCNGTDDDCDDAVDEDFRDASGLYVSRLACGSCATPCVEPGPNMVATCSPDAAGVDGVRCDVVCEDGFVNVDRIDANGCECRRFDGSGPPPVVGGDGDCDGVPDDTTDYVYVTSTGSDTNAGSLAHPMRTPQAGLARGRTEHKSVLVATGSYAGFDIVAGVSIFGGYSPDFTDRDLDLYPVVLENLTGRAGSPALRCRGVRTATRVEGFTVHATDATGPSEGSTAVFSDGCDATVALAEVLVLAGRGVDGARGDSSSNNLSEIGLVSLDQLNGTNGADGRMGTPLGAACAEVRGGVAGAKTCPGGSVSGGVGGAASCNGDPLCRNGSRCGNGGCTDYTVGGVCDIASVLRDAVANPAPGVARGMGAGLSGELTYNAPTNRFICNFCDDNPSLARFGGNGGDGSLGANGAAGLGCGGLPAFDSTTGTASGGTGTNGSAGADGAGGGGATAGAGYLVIAATPGDCASMSGGSGGGGGSGGCGAPRAEAGTGGGASIGIAVRLGPGVTAGPTMSGVRVVTASAGEGGAGGIGAGGGSGGTGAAGGNGVHWCARGGGRGGDGGRGGAGGGGGGGCGGGSHGVYIVSAGADATAYADAVRAAVEIDATGVPGRGGAGGFSPGVSGTAGTNGGGEEVRVVP